MARLLLLAVVAALMLAASGSAATIDDVRALGYTVGIANTVGGCTIYSVSGYGVNGYLNGCDQAAIDQFANPAAHCNRVWQASHSDQYAAFRSISAKGYGISGDQCADSYTVTDKTGATVYNGGGAGLPGFDAANGPAPEPSAGVPTPNGGAATPPGTCLPLCPTPKPVDPVGASSSSVAVAPTSSMEPGFTLDVLLAVTRRIINAGTAVPV